MLLARNCDSADLARRLKTAAAAESADLLEQLVAGIAAPLVRRTVKRRFSTARHTTPEDLDDVCADSLAAIIVRLRRHAEGGPEIVDFENYAATVASNTADRFFAARAPQRARLRNRIRYALTTDPRFVIREFETGLWLCALRNKPASTPLAGAELEACRQKIAVTKLSVNKLPELLREILCAASGALELTDVTTFAAHAMGVTDRTDSVEDHAPFLLDPAVPFTRTAELKDWLKRLWEEICQLPPLQRVALLLNLGSAGGAHAGTTMCAIADLGIASFGALASTLEMTETQLAAIWNRIPLEDNEIAGSLQLERQQVINLRASARQRLGRRMSALDNLVKADSASGTNTEAPRDTRKLNR